MKMKVYLNFHLRTNFVADDESLKHWVSSTNLEMNGPQNNRDTELWLQHGGGVNGSMLVLV